jgi:biotin carboxyl carrier protein
MTTYVALLDGGKREETIEVRQSAPGLYEVGLRGKLHVVDAFRHDHGTLSLIIDTASYSAMLDWRGTKVNVRLRHSIIPIEILDEKKLRLRRAVGKFSVEGKQNVTSPMPGKIVKVLVAVGDEVKEGQGLVVVEAMKMENELAALRAGRVKDVQVRDGMSVEAGRLLLVVE